MKNILFLNVILYYCYYLCYSPYHETGILKTIHWIHPVYSILKEICQFLLAIVTERIYTKHKKERVNVTCCTITTTIPSIAAERAKVMS